MSMTWLNPKSRVVFSSSKIYILGLFLLMSVFGGRSLAEPERDLDRLTEQITVSFRDYQIQVATRNYSNLIVIQIQAGLTVTADSTDRFYFTLADINKLQIT